MIIFLFGIIARESGGIEVCEERLNKVFVLQPVIKERHNIILKNN